MGGLVDSIFNPGGAAKDAAREQTAATRESMEMYKQGVEEAKQAINPAFDQAQLSRLQGTLGAAETLGQGFAGGLAALQQGNMNAQNVLNAGGQNAMSAVLGGAINPSAYQTQGISFDPNQFMSGLTSLQALQGQFSDLQNAQQTPQPQVVPTPDGTPAVNGNVLNGNPSLGVNDQWLHAFQNVGMMGSGGYFSPRQYGSLNPMDYLGGAYSIADSYPTIDLPNFIPR